MTDMLLPHIKCVVDRFTRMCVCVGAYAPARKNHLPPKKESLIKKEYI